MGKVSFQNSKLVFLFVVTLGFLPNQVLADAVDQCVSLATTIERKLSCLPGVSWSEVQNPKFPGQVRQFELKIEQPVDHQNFYSGQFLQRLVLLHRSDTDPVVLQTNGYRIFGVRLSELAQHFSTNQIQVEHRFFADSRPLNQEIPWDYLNIYQSAQDFHAITVLFKKIYSGKWVNTGASKGGMTSIYHRYFFPADLDGTLADVAPHSYSPADQRYVDFLREVGGSQYAQCREDLKKMQVALLNSRDQVIPKITGSFKNTSVERAFEDSVLGAYFSFWQYSDPLDSTEGCAAIPTTGTVEEKFAFLQTMSPIKNYQDSFAADFAPYFFQAATELGSPMNLTSHLEKFLNFPLEIYDFKPKGTKGTYSHYNMIRVQDWVSNSAEKIIFIYGELDPWTGGAFEAGAPSRAVYKFEVPGGNHGSTFLKLPGATKTQAVQQLSTWLGRAPTTSLQSEASRPQSLDDFENNVRKSNRRRL